jgi:signal transduction histidine kinase
MNRRLRNIYVFMAAGLLLAVGLILAVSHFAAGRQNDMSRATQQEIVRFETRHLLDALAGKLSPMIYWQEAYDKVSASWDQKWVGYQFGSYLDSLNINEALIFDDKFGLRHTYTHGLENPPGASDILGSTTLKAIYTKALNAKSQQPPVLEQAVVMLDGLPYFAVAGQIVPEEDKLFPIPASKRRIVIFLDLITPSDYAALAGGFGVANIRIDSRDHTADGMASVNFAAANGQVVTKLWWAPQKPGDGFLRIAIPLSIAVFLALAGLQFLILKRFQSLNTAWLKAEAKAEAAEEESAAKSAFLGTISHELRTPLNAIIGFADMLNHKIFGPLGSPRYEEYVQHIRTSGHSLLNTINDVIEISRIEAGDTAIECVPTDITDALDEAMLVVLPKAEARGIRLCLDGTNVNPIWCRASPLSLKHVIARILDNAVKFSIDSSVVEISLGQHKGYVTLEIRDYGIGIEEDKLELLGRPFVQGETHMVRTYAGIGLGLAISRGLMNLMNGTLNISSQEGIGTIVTLKLERVRAPLMAKKAA